MKTTKLYFLIFSILILGLNYSLLSTFPTKVVSAEEVGGGVAIYDGNKIVIYTFDDVERGEIGRLKEFNKETAYSNLIRMGSNFFIINLLNSSLIVDDGFEEIYRLNYTVKKAIEKNNGYYLISDNEVYFLRMLQNNVEESLIFKSIDLIREGEINSNYLIIATTNKLTLIPFNEEELIKEIEIPSLSTNFEVFKGYIYFGDSFGSLYRINFNGNVEVVERFNSTLMKLKATQNYLIVVSSNSIAALSLSTKKEDYVKIDLAKKVIELDPNTVVVLGKNSAYVFNIPSGKLISEKMFGFKIRDGASYKGNLLVFGTNKEMAYLKNEDVKEGCVIKYPPNYLSIGTIEINLKLYSTKRAKVFAKRNVIGEGEGEFSIKLNPLEYEEGEKITIKCGEGEFAPERVLIRENSPVGKFVVIGLPERIKEGEILNITVENQFGERVEEFNVIVNGKSISSPQNPFQLTQLPPGEVQITLTKEGYETFTTTTYVEEDIISVLLKLVLGSLLLIGGVYYLLKIGILDKLIAKLKKRFKKEEE